MWNSNFLNLYDYEKTNFRRTCRSALTFLQRLVPTLLQREEQLPMALFSLLTVPTTMVCLPVFATILQENTQKEQREK